MLVVNFFYVVNKCYRCQCGLFVSTSLASLTRFSIACLQALLAFVSMSDAAVEITTQHDVFAEVVRECCTHGLGNIQNLRISSLSNECEFGLNQTPHTVY